MSNLDKIILPFMAVLMGFIMVLICVVMPLAATTTAGCYAAGWPDARVDIFFNRYCVRRVDQTDIIVPYRERNK